MAKETRPTKDVKQVMYIGYPGDQGTPFMFHGSIAFYPRHVQPVANTLYEAVRHIHKFVDVEGQFYKVLDFPESGSVNFAETNSLVQ